MKRILVFLLVAIGFLSTEKLFAQNNVCLEVEGQVRYAFELKKLTKAEADDAQAQGYVELWTYMCFDQSFVGFYNQYTENNLIDVVGGEITAWRILSALNTHSYKMIDKYGNEDRTGSVAMFAKPSSLQSCPGRPNISQMGVSESGAIGNTFIQGGCPTWAYASSSETSGAFTGNTAKGYCTTLEAEGKTWYCLKMYKVRFEYKQASSFYVTFYKGNSVTGDELSNGSCTFNVRAGSTNVQLIWPGKACGVGGQDWSDNYGKNDRYGFIPGGVEVIADPEMELTADATCGGSDVTGVLNVNDWASKSWADYSGVEFYVSKKGGTRQAVSQGATGITLTPGLPSAAGDQTTPISYTLSPAAYMIGTQPADSLIWVIKGKNGTNDITVKTKLNITKLPKLYFAATDASVEDAELMNKPLLPRPAGVITIGETDRIIGKWTCDAPLENGSSNPLAAGGMNCFWDEEDNELLSNATLYRGETKNGTYSLVAGKFDNATPYFSASHFVGSTGYYYMKLSYKGCDVYTDTVEIKVTKPLEPPVVALNTDCGQKISATAKMSGFDSDPEEWEWVVCTDVIVEGSTITGPDQTKGYGFIVKNNEVKTYTRSSVFDGMSLNWRSIPSGEDCDFEFYSPAMDYATSESPLHLICQMILPTTMDGGSGWVWNVSNAETKYTIPGKRLFVRCKVNGEWSGWAFAVFPADVANQCSTNVNAVPGPYAPPLNFAGFFMGISARECPGQVTVAPYSSYFCSATDTQVVVGTLIKFRLYLAGRILMNSTVTHDFTTSTSTFLYYQYAPMQILWQVLDKTTNQWVTWAVTPNTAQTSIQNGLLHYVESPARIITEAGTYRAVVSLAQDCKTQTTTGDNSIYTDDPYEAGKKDDAIWTLQFGNIGTFADVANVTLTTSVIPGTIKGRSDGGAWKANSLDMCFSSVADLTVEDFNVPAANLTWQKLDGGTWKDVSPAVTGDTYNNVPIGADGDDLYTVRTLTFRIKAVDADNQENFSDPFTINVYKARPLNVGYVGYGGVVKDTVAGYCYGSTVYPRVQNGATVLTPATNPTGVRNVAIQYTRTANMASWSFPTNGNWLTYVGNTYNTSDVLNQATWNLYRTVSYNGPASTPTLCRADGEPIVVKMNPPVVMGSLNTITEVCAGVDTTLTISGSSNMSVYNWAVYKGSNVDQAYPNQGTSLRRSYQEGTYNVLVMGYGVFGNKTKPNPTSQDTTQCPAPQTYTTVTSVVCALPAPVPNPANICKGETGVLMWTEVFKPATQKLMYRIGTGAWAEVPAGKWSHTVITTPSSYTRFTLDAAWLTAGSSYTFRIDENSPGNVSDDLTVIPVPDAPVVSGLSDITVCAGEKAEFKPTATGTITGPTYKYEWVKGNGSDTTTVKSSNLTYTVNNAATVADDGTYRLHTIASYSVGSKVCADTNFYKADLTVNPAPTMPTSVTVTDAPDLCAGASHTFVPVVMPPTAPTGHEPYEYTWTPKNGLAGSVDANGKDYTVQTQKNTTADTYKYEFKVVVKTEKGCKDSVYPEVSLKVVGLPAKPAFNPNISNQEVCEGASISFSPQATPRTHFYWYKSATAGGPYTAANQVAGGTTGSLTLSFSPAALTDEGYYKLLVIHNNGTCADSNWSDEAKLTVNPKAVTPGVSFAKTAPRVCAGNAIDLQATVSDAATGAIYRWTKGGAALTTPATPAKYSIASAATTDAGKYKLEVVNVTDKGCRDSAYNEAELTVVALPTLNSVTVAPQAGCDQVTLTATPNPTSGSYLYQWYTGTDTTAANMISGATSSTYQTSTSGNYAVRVIAGANGCELRKFGTGTATVVPTPAQPTVSLALNPNQTEFCQGDNLTITASPAPDGTKYTYTWTKPAGTPANVNNVVTLTNMQTSASGSYAVSVTEKAVSGSTTCTSAAGTASTTITVKQKPVIFNASISGNAKYCEGDAITLTANATSAAGTASYNWQYSADGTSFADVTPACTTAAYTIASAQTTHSGTYKVQITYKNSTVAANTCQDVAEVTHTLTVNKQPDVGTLTISGKTSECQGNAVTLTATVTKSVVVAGIRTYTWKKDGSPVATHISDAITDTYTVPATEAAGTYTYTCIVGDTVDNCSSSDNKTHSLTINATPTNPTVSLAAPAVCSDKDLELTATAGATGSSSVSFRWFAGADTSSGYITTTTATMSSSPITHKWKPTDPNKPVPTAALPVATKQYTVKAVFGANTCSAEKTATFTATVVKKPADITVGFDPNEQTVCKGTPVNVSAGVSSADDPNANYTYTWTTTATSGITGLVSDNTLNISSAAVNHRGKYTLKVDAKYENAATNTSCTATNSGDFTLTVTEPADLSNIAIKDNKTDTCVSGGDHTLSVSNMPTLPAGATATYKWYKDAGTTPIGTDATLTVPAQLNSSGTYKVEVDISAGSNNPCTSSGSATMNLVLKFCEEEPLTAGTGQDDNIVFICQKDKNSDASWVEYTATKEVTAIQKVRWYKSATNFTSGVAGGTSIGSSDIEAPFSWPLKLTQREVFNGVSAPAQFYVRARIEREVNGIVSVTYSSVYRFALVENAPKITTLTITPTDDTICLGSGANPSATESFTASNTTTLTAPSGYSGLGITAKLQPNATGVTYIWKWNTETGFTPAPSPKNATVNGEVNKAPMYVKAVSGYIYNVGNINKVCYDTSDERVGYVTTTLPPVIASFKDGDNATSKTLCANTDASGYPTLTVDVTRGTVVKWEKSTDNSTWTDFTDKVTSTDKLSYTLTADEVTKPTGSTDVINYYRVTVRNGSKCDPATANYTLTLVSMPDLTDVVITGKTPAPEFEFCNTGTLTANPKKSGNAAYSGTTPTYRWQKSATGNDPWTDVAGVSGATLNLTTAPDSNFYRCIATVTKTGGTAPNTVSCPVSVTADSVQVTVSASSSKGTSSIDKTAICTSETAAFKVEGHTGDISKIEISNADNFPTASTVTVTPGSTSYTINPAFTNPNIAGLLSTTSRKTTLYVRATIQSGGVCASVTSDPKKVDVYKPAPTVTIGAIADMCKDVTISSNATPADGKYSPAIETAFEEITWSYGGYTSNANNLVLDYAVLAPKYSDDTIYTLTATVKNKVLSTCADPASTPVQFKVNRAAQTPVTSKDTILCEGGEYTVSAIRPASSNLIWKKDGTVLSDAEVDRSNAPIEKVTVSNAAQGVYKYTIADHTACPPDKDKDVTVTVNQKPAAGTISVPDGTNGDFCSGTNVQVTADAGSYTLPTGGAISWQVCTDKNNYIATRQTSLESGSGASYSKASNLFTVGTTYYIRYGVSGPTCETEYSDWVAVKVIQAPVITAFTVSSGNNNHICVDSTVTLTVTGNAGLKYEFFSNTSNNTTSGSLLTGGSGYIGAGGSATINVSPAVTTYYYAKLTDTSYHGSDACGVSAPSSLMTVNVDPKNVGGELVFTNTDIAGQPTDNGKKLQGNVGEHTAQLRLDGAVGTNKQLNGVSDKGVAVPAKSINPTASLPLSTDHMDVTQLWVVVSGGACPDAYSDTVELTVKVGSEPTLSVSTICQGNASTLSINVPEAIKTDLNIIELQYQNNGTWEKVTSASFGGVTGTAPNFKIAISESLTATLAAGDHKFRFIYKVGADGTETPSSEVTLHVDAPSVGGTLTATLDTVCQNGTSPVLKLSGHTGEIQGTFFKATTFTNNVDGGSKVSPSTDSTNLYSVPTSDLSRSGYYRVEVKSGVCPATYSNIKEVRVIPTPVAGTLSAGTACFDGNATVNLSSNHQGDIIVWKTSSSATGTYTDVPNSNQTSYTLNNLTDHVFVKVAVTTHSVCAAVETPSLEVLVYDTLKFTKQPSNKSVVVGNNVELEAEADNTGLKYDNGSGSAFESNMPATYQWQMQNADGSWSDISNGSDFAGVTTTKLTIKAANAETYVGTYFRCVATDAHNCKTVASNPATIELLADLKPGETNSLTACECYYSTDEATYFVTGAAGQGTLSYRWQVSTNGSTWKFIDDEDVFGSDVASVCKGYDKDTIVFFEIGKLYHDKSVRYIRAWVSDEVNTAGSATIDKTVEVCMVDKPKYTFEGDIVCENETSASFAFTATPTTPIDQRDIKYAYALRSNPANFTDIATNPSVTFGDKTLTFTRSGDNLSIASAIPFEADSMIIRMEVRSCYTPEPLATNTDTTMYAVLRVDKAPEITLLRDTIVCKGSDVTLTARAVAATTTIPGNEITLQITPGGLPYTQPVEAVNTLDLEISNIQNTTTYTAKAKTTYCPEKTSTATVTVKEIPVLSSMRAEPVCLGNTLSFEASVTNYDASTCQIRWLKKVSGVWDTIARDILTYTKNNVTAEDAGEYALLMRVTVPSCASEVLQPFTFKVWVTPEIVLTPSGNVLVVKTKTATVTAKPKTLAEMGYSADLIPYLYLVEPSDYEWYIQKNGAGSFEKLTGSNHTSLINSAVNGSTLTFVGVEGYDSTLFYVVAKTDCEPEVQTPKDTLRLTDKFDVTDVTILPDPACEGEDVTIVARTTAPAAYVEWQVSTNGGDSWTTITMPSATYDSTWADGTYTLTIHNVTASMEGYVYRVLVREEENGEDVYSADKEHGVFIGKPAVLHVDKPVKFNCADKLTKDEPVVVVGGTPASSQFTFNTDCVLGACTGSDHTCNVDYDYQLSKPVGGVTQRDAYASVGTASNYEFTPGDNDLGINLILFRAGNHCGWDSAYDSVLVIQKPEPGPVTAIGTGPGKDPDDPDPMVVEGPSTENITVEICEGNTLYLSATYTGGPAEGFQWQVNGSPVPMSAPYSLRNDTLVISPVPVDFHNNVYRCVFDMPGNVADITSYTITVHVNTKPDVSKVEVEIWDVTNKDAEDLESGQALPGGTVELSVPDAPAGYTQICFYQAFVHEEEGEGDDVQIVVDSVKLIHCGNTLTYELTTDASVAEHDNTWYYAQIHNDCGYDSTMPYQLRVFEDLKVVWIPDTMIERPSGEKWDHTTYPDPKPGDLVILYLPGEEPNDTIQVEAHLWVCQNGEFTVSDTTRTGFMNRQTGDSKEEMEEDGRENEPSYHNSRWFYRAPGEEEWHVFNPVLDPWYEMWGDDGDGNLSWAVKDHKGDFGFTMPTTFDVDGYEFRAVGENARYADTTCIITLHVIPSLQKGDLVMEPEEITACYETDAEFRLTSVKDLSKLTLDWQVKPAGGEWSENIDSLHNDSIYTVGKVGLPYNGYEVRAIAQGACGSDTVYGRIVINTPVAPGVKLLGDTVCLGESLILTAQDTGQAGHSAFAWYVDGDLVPGETGETFDVSAYEGNHTVKVVMTADLNANTCVRPETAEAEVLIAVNPLPEVDAHIRDTEIKTGATTEVWATGGDGYTYEWTPEGYVANPTDSATATNPFDHAGKKTFTVTATNEFGCEASDSVELNVLSNFRLDSIPTTTVTPPILPNDEGTLPGFPDDSYPIFGEGVTVIDSAVFYQDEAHLWVCPGNEVRIVIATSGGEKPIKYSWSRVDGNAYPHDTTGTLSGWSNTGASTQDYVIEDSIIVFFFPDSSTHQFNCHITEGAGSELDIRVYVHYFVPERIYIETRPKTTSTKFYEDQAIYFHARPQRYPDYYWVRLAGLEEDLQITDRRASKEAMYATSFKMEQPDERNNQIWVSAIDRHGCRIWDSTSVELMKLPNVMVIGDPNRPIDDIIFPEFEVEITNMWGLRIKAFRDRNGNGSTRGWDGRTPSGVKVTAGTYYYKVKIPTLDGFVYMTGAVTVINR